MTLRTDFYEGATGLQQKLIDAHDAGVTFVTDNLVTLSTELKNAAAAGKTTFTVTLTTSFQPTYLRLNGLLLKAYLSGITAGLDGQDVMSFECTPALNTSDAMTTSIDFKFTFQTT